MWLKQSTASQSRLTPRFVDEGDFKTPETALTIANTDVKISKNGAATVNKNSGGGTHREAGRYSLTFDATDTDTVGEFAVGIIISGALPVEFKFYVLEEAIFDALFGPSAAAFNSSQRVDIGLLLGSAPNALVSGRFDSSVGAMASGVLTAAAIASAAFSAAKFAADTGLTPITAGTAQAGTASTIQLASATSIPDSAIKNAIVAIQSGTGAGQARAISAWVSSTDTATVDTNWDITPDNTSVYVVYYGAPAVIPSAASIRTEIDSNSTQLAKLGTPAGASISADIAAAKVDTAAIKTKTDNLPANTSTVLGTPAGASLAADIAAVKVDSAAIKAKTDLLSFTDTNRVNCDVRRVNSVTLQGAGTSGDKWRPA